MSTCNVIKNTCTAVLVAIAGGLHTAGGQEDASGAGYGSTSVMLDEVFVTTCKSKESAQDAPFR